MRWRILLGYLLIITPWECTAITNKRASPHDVGGSVRNFRHIPGPSAETSANWEAGLREAALQSLLRERHSDPHLRDRLRAAPLIGRRDASAAFGDVVVLARGQLYATGGGRLAFVQDRQRNDCDDCYNARRCDRHQCQAWTPKNQERLLALWTVKRLRHRDFHDKNRYEIEYTVSPLNDATRDIVIRKGRFNYAIPGHIFVIRSGESGKKAADKYGQEIYNRKIPHNHYLPNIPVGYDPTGHQHILHSYPGFFTSDSEQPPHQKLPATTDPKEIELYKKLIEALASKTSTTVKTEEGPHRVSLNHYGGITTPQGVPMTESAAMRNYTTLATVSTSPNVLATTPSKTGKTDTMVMQFSTRFNVTSTEASKGTMPTKKYQAPTKKPVYTLPKTEKSKPITKPTKPQISVTMKAATTTTSSAIVSTPSSTTPLKPTTSSVEPQTISSHISPPTSISELQTTASHIMSTTTASTSTVKPQTLATYITSTTTRSAPKPQTIASPIISTTETTSAPKPQITSTTTTTTTTSATKPQSIASHTNFIPTTTSASKPPTIASHTPSTTTTTKNVPKPQIIVSHITSTTTTTTTPKPPTVASQTTLTITTTTKAPKPQTITTHITPTSTTTTSSSKVQTITSHNTPTTTSTTKVPKPQTITSHITPTSTTTTSSSKPQTITSHITPTTTTTTKAPKPQTMASHITSTTTTTISALKPQTIISHITPTTTTEIPKPQTITSHITSTTTVSTSFPQSQTTASPITSTTSRVTPQSATSISTLKPSTIVSHVTKFTTKPPLSTIATKINMTTTKTTTTPSKIQTAVTKLPSSQTTATTIPTKPTTTANTMRSTTPTTDVTSTTNLSETMPTKYTSASKEVPSSTTITTIVSTTSTNIAVTSDNGSMTSTAVPATTITKFPVKVSSIVTNTLETTSEMPQSHSVREEQVNNYTTTPATMKETVHTESTTFELEKATEPTNQMPAPSTETQTTPFSDISTTTQETRPEVESTTIGGGSEVVSTETSTSTSEPTSSKAAPAENIPEMTSQVPKTTTASDFLTDAEPIKDPINTKPVKEDYDLDDIFGSSVVTTKPASTTTQRLTESDLALQLFGNKELRNAKVIFSNFYEASTSTRNADMTLESEPITSQSYETSISYQVKKRRTGEEASSTARSKTTRRKPKSFKYRGYKSGAAKTPQLDTTTPIVTATTNPSRPTTESRLSATESLSATPDAPRVEYTESTLNKPTESRETTEASRFTTKPSPTDEGVDSAREAFDDLAMRLVNHARGLDYMSKRSSRPTSRRYKKRTYSPRSRKTTRKRIRSS